MKKIILLQFLLLTLGAHAQPKLVGALKYSGVAEGGAIYRLDRPGISPGILHSFDNLSPHKPGGSVTVGNAGWLYGMLQFNGANNKGGLYRVRQDGTGFTMLYNLTNFAGSNLKPFYHTDGMIYFSDEFSIKKYNPSSNNVTDIPLNTGVYVRNFWIDSNDWIYLMTSGGTLAKIKTDGTQWTDLHSFNPSLEGSGGIAGVTEVPGNVIFGVESYGGLHDGGTLYSIHKDGTGFTVHHHFDNTTGFQPESQLVYFDGKLFGTTAQGGNFGYGVLYTVNADGTGYRVLYNLELGSFGPGEVPSGNLAITSNGRIFGSFSQFVVFSFNYSRLFKVDTSGQNFSVFMTVDQREHGHMNLGVTMSDDETIFLATAEMGRHDGGVLTQVDTSGFATGLYQFGYSVNGFRPGAALIKGSNGKLYGTTVIGGASGNGTIFSMNIDGTAYTKLHEFTDAEGFELSGKLLEASDGKLYGACQRSSTNTGCIYRIDKSGSNFEIIYQFTDIANGYGPVGSLVEDNTGKLYGVTFYSLSGSGVVFKMDKNGANYTVLKNFLTNTEPIYSYDGLVLSGNYLYGTGSQGGPEFKGGVFRIRTDGTGYEVLHIFSGSTDGSTPFSAPTMASNGKLYGVTSGGGATSEGTIFSMNPDGSNYNIIKNLSGSTDGSYPQSALIQASDGLLYGSTIFGTGGTGGGVFKLNLDGTGFIVIKQFDLSTEGQFSSSPLDLGGSVALPVNLINFNASKKDKSVLLTWQTANEQNSKAFQIQRSADASSFGSIGTVVGVGNSNTISNYSFTDDKPADGINYYRLKQIDADEKFVYSNIVAVQMNSTARFAVFPNPASNRITIQIPKTGNVKSIQLFNADGKLVMEKQITSTTTVSVLDIQHLPAGWYVVQLSGATIMQEKILKTQ